MAISGQEETIKNRAAGRVLRVNTETGQKVWVPLRYSGDISIPQGGNRNKSRNGLGCLAKLSLALTCPLLAAVCDSVTSLGGLVSTACCNKTPQSRQLINHRHLFLPVLEAGKSKMKAPINLVFGKFGVW